MTVDTVRVCPVCWRGDLRKTNPRTGGRGPDATHNWTCNRSDCSAKFDEPVDRRRDYPPERAATLWSIAVQYAVDKIQDGHKVSVAVSSVPERMFELEHNFEQLEQRVRQEIE